MSYYNKIRNRIFKDAKKMKSREFFYEFGQLIYEIDNAYEQYGKRSNLSSPNLLWILYALNDGKTHTQKSVCDDWQIPRSTANTIVKELEEKGLLSLSHLEGTRREMVICLTDAGKVFADEVLSKLYEKEKEIFEKAQDPDKLLEELRSFTKLLAILTEE